MGRRWEKQGCKEARIDEQLPCRQRTSIEIRAAPQPPLLRRHASGVALSQAQGQRSLQEQPPRLDGCSLSRRDCSAFPSALSPALGFTGPDRVKASAARQQAAAAERERLARPHALQASQGFGARLAC